MMTKYSINNCYIKIYGTVIINIYKI